MTYQDRHIPLTGARNFRDFGGYKTTDGRHIRKGILYRSDGLSELTGDDYRIISRLGIRSIGDLRRNQELRRSPTRWVDPSTRIYRLPLLSEAAPSPLKEASKFRQDFDEEVAQQLMVDVYQHLVTGKQAQKSYRQLFTLLADNENLPILIHCSGGKDRTGVSCALTLWLLGVGWDDIVEDYLHSQSLYSDKVDVATAASQLFEHNEVGDWQHGALRAIFGVQQKYLEAAFGVLAQRKLTPEGFLSDFLGLDAGLLDTLKSTLLTNQ